MTLNLGPMLEWVFGGDLPRDPLELHQVAARAAVVYVVGLVIVRVGKSRLIGRASALDVILGFILGSLLSRGINGHASISGTIVASAVLVGVHWAFTAIGTRSHRFGMLIKGHSRPVIENGRVNQDNLRRSHLSEHDLGEALRLQGIERLDEVKTAYKERSGEISAIRKRAEPRVLEIAIRDGVQTVRIQLG